MPARLKKVVKYRVLFSISLILTLLGLFSLSIFSLQPLVVEKEVSSRSLQQIENLIANYRLKIWKKSPPYYFEYNQEDINAFIHIFNSTHTSVNIKLALKGEQFLTQATYQVSFFGFPLFINMKGVGAGGISQNKLTVSPNQLKIGFLKIPNFLYHSVFSLISRYHSELGLPTLNIGDINYIQLKNEILHVKLNRGLSAQDILNFAPQKKIRLSPQEKQLIQQITFQTLLNLKDETTGTDLFQKLVKHSFQLGHNLGKKHYETQTLNKLSILSIGLFYQIPIISEEIGIDDELSALFKTANIKLYRYKIFKRKDWARHFVYSAVLTALLGEEITKKIGEVKEIRDFKFSGFSFSDLLADRAGAIFAKTLLTTPENGQYLRNKIISDFLIEDFFPNQSDLPDNLKKEEFEKIFEFSESELYQKTMRNINTQIYQSRAYQTLPMKH